MEDDRKACPYFAREFIKVFISASTWTNKPNGDATQIKQKIAEIENPF